MMAIGKGQRTWITFGACAAAVIAALGWTTASILRLERAERAARQQADLQERIRVALWRMDSIIAPRIAEEAARPYFHYASFYAPKRAYTRMLSPVLPGEVLVPSPLLKFSDPYIRLHFQVDPHGGVVSPQVPTGSLRALAEESYTTSADITAASGLFDEFVKTAGRDMIKTTPQAALRYVDRQQESNAAISSNAFQIKNSAPAETAQSAQEWGNRAQNVQVSQKRAIAQQQMAQTEDDAPNPAVTVSLFAPVWKRAGKPDAALLFVRHVSVGETELTQGIWMDWPVIRQTLLDAIGDLLPGAELGPTDTPEKADPGTLLASIPAVLHPGKAGAMAGTPVTPLRALLVLAWVVVLGAIGTVGVVLQAAVDLSRRRGEFVSSVTHELRTPLTTFRMYSEMLAEGMVPDEHARQEYLATLRDESDHLSCLVENVLTYARIEQGRSMATRRERMTVDELIARATVRPAERAKRAGAQMTIDVGNGCCGNGEGTNGSLGAISDIASAVVLTDPAAVEQIVGNLIDNAIKYACPSDPRIELRVSRDAAANVLCIGVADHGPGIDPKDAARIFKPFIRGSKLDRSVQGVGLGLAISRQLARDLGGDLRLCEGHGGGAKFELRLPVVQDSHR